VSNGQAITQHQPLQMDQDVGSIRLIGTGLLKVSISVKRMRRATSTILRGCIRNRGTRTNRHVH
jgi:hypothetical protein